MKNLYTSVELRGNSVYVRSIRAGKREQHIDKSFRPELFLPTSESTEYTTVYGNPVKPFFPGRVRDCREFIDRYKHNDKYRIWGNERWLYQYIGKEWPEDITWSMKDLNVVYIDIECASENGFPDVDSAEEDLLLITVSQHGKRKTFGTGRPYEGTENIDYVYCSNEHQLITDFLSYWKKLDPDIVTGWNVNLFDIPYLVNRIKKLFGEEEASWLSPWKRIRERPVNMMGRDYTAYILSGISILDYYDLYKKYTYTDRESYKLDYICHLELGERKLSHDEHANMHSFYKNDWEKFVEYNVHDVRLVEKLEAKLRLLELQITVAYDAKINFDDVFSQVKTWDAIIYNWLRKKDVVIPMRKDREDAGTTYTGAYVKEPLVGIHKWIMSFDLNSLYPHLIMQYNISPDTLKQDEIHKAAGPDNIIGGYVTAPYKEYTMAANGTLYRKDKRGFLPELMHRMYARRTEYKTEMIECQSKALKATGAIKRELDDRIAQLNSRQMATKVSLNSAYGAVGNPYFRYYDVRQAEAITQSGQLAIKWIGKRVNEWMNTLLKTEGKDYIIASDTDSIYLDCEDLVKTVYPDDSDTAKIVDFLDTGVSKKLSPFIAKCFEELATRVNAYEQKMVMGREVIADKGIWVAKKRYILNVHDSEGVRYDTPKLKIMGIETQKSSTPELCRAALVEAFKTILNKDESALQDYVDEFKDRFFAAEPEDIAFPRGVRGLTKFAGREQLYIKGTPIHVKGALIYNHKLKELGLTNKYPIIQEGEKIRFIYLKEPNPAKDKVLSFLSVCPDEFGLEDFIDKQTQFEKAFLVPLTAVLDTIGWSAEKVSTLEGLFA